jgi:hypothetical protein
MNNFLKKSKKILLLDNSFFRMNIFNRNLNKSSVFTNTSKFSFSSNNKNDKNNEDKKIENDKPEEKLDKKIDEIQDKNSSEGNDPNKDPKGNKNNSKFAFLKALNVKNNLYIYLALGFLTILTIKKLSQNNNTLINLSVIFYLN